MEKGQLNKNQYCKQERRDEMLMNKEEKKTGGVFEGDGGGVVLGMCGWRSMLKVK